MKSKKEQKREELEADIFLDNVVSLIIAAASFTVWKNFINTGFQTFDRIINLVVLITLFMWYVKKRRKNESKRKQI